MKYFCTTLFIVLLSASNSVFAKYLFQKIHVKNGQHSYNEIYSIEKNKDGYIVLATDNGLYYYDGTNTCMYNDMLVGSDKKYIGFYKDDNNNLYVLPYYYYVTKLGATATNEYKMYKQIPLSTSYYAYQNKDTINWMIIYNSVSSGHCLLDRKDSMYFYKKVVGRNEFYISFLESKKVIINNVYKDILKMLNNYTYTDIGIINNSYLIVGTKLYQIKNRNIELVFDLRKYNLKGTILKLSEGKGGKIFFCLKGDNEGAYCFYNNTVELLYNDDMVTSIQEDDQDNILISTINNGLLCLKKNLSQIQYFSFSPIANRISNVYIQDENTSYVSDVLGNIYFFDRNNNMLKKISSSNSAKGYRNYFVKPNANSLENIFQNKCITLRRDAVLSKNKQEYNKDVVLINHIKVPQYDLHFGQTFFYANNKFHQLHCKIKNCLNVNDTIILLASDNGLFALDISRNFLVQKVITNALLDTLQITDIKKYKKGFIYLTSDVLFISDSRNKITTIQLQNKPISTMIIHENIIVVYKNGFSMYDSTGRLLNSMELFNTNYSDGLLGGQYIDDTMLLYNYNKYYKVPYRNFLQTQYSNEESIQLKGVYLKNANAKYASLEKNKYSFTWMSQNSLEIYLHYFNNYFNRENSLNYYFIQKKDTILSNTIAYPYTISFNNIKPGNYRVIVANTKVLGAFAIQIVPRYFQTLWFKVLLSCLIIGLTIYFSIYFVKRHNAKVFQNLSIQNRILSLQSSSLLNQLNPHFIFNALIPLQKYLLLSDTDKGVSYLNNFSNVLRNMLYNSREHEIVLDKEIGFLKQYLALQKIEKSDSFYYYIATDIDNTLTDKILVPSMLLQPIVENSIMHGMATNSSKDNFIQIIFTVYKKEYLQIKITDSGEGYDEHVNTLFKKNNALQIVKERIHILKIQTKKELTSFAIQKNSNGFETSILIPYKVRKDEN